MYIRTTVVALLMAVCAVTSARADLITTWDFSGTFVTGTNPGQNKITAISGTFSLDETVGHFAITSFDFTFDGGGVIAPSDTWTATALDTTQNSQQISELLFRHPLFNNNVLELLFTSPVESFNGSTFISGAGTPESGLVCLDIAAGCGTTQTAGALFNSGTADPVPEPAALVLMGSFILGFVGWRSRVSKR